MEFYRSIEVATALSKRTFESAYVDTTKGILRVYSKAADHNGPDRLVFMTTLRWELVAS